MVPWTLGRVRRRWEQGPEARLGLGGRGVTDRRDRRGPWQSSTRGGGICPASTLLSAGSLSPQDHGAAPRAPGE